MKIAEIEVIKMNNDVVVTSPGCDPELIALGFAEG